MRRGKIPSRDEGEVRPLIGIAVDGASAYGRGIMRGIMQYANAQRRWEIYSVLRGTLDTIPRQWPRCDGSICAGALNAFVEQVRVRSRHCILCSGSARPRERNVVCVDDIAVGVMAAEHLLECRTASFAFVGMRGTPHSVKRQRGFAAELERCGQACHVCPIDHPGIPTNLEHWPALIAWLRTLPRPVGLLAVDDMVAHDLSAACLQFNIAVPEHVAILGVNNDDLLCESAWPPLSSVDIGSARIGYAAAHLMHRLLAGERLSVSGRHLRLPPLHVVRRQSTDVLAIDDPMVVDAVRFIREHACDPCSVDDVLRRVPLSRRSLEMKFTEKLGRGPGEEILRVQMETARRLLLQPGLTLPAIAERCGFSDGSAFGRAFRRTVGRSPAAYRRGTLNGK